MSAHFTTPTDELLLLAETLGEVKTKADKLEAEFATQARPLEAATNALSAALSGIKALQFHVLDNNLGALSARVEEMRKAVDEQVGVIALELKKADETNAAKAGQEAEALRSEIAALQAQLGTLGAQFAAQLERVEFSAKEEAKKLQLIPGPAGAAGASLNPRGTFIDGETYNRLDVVSWLGSSYIAAVDGVTEKPSRNSNQWQVLASRGGGSAGGAADFGSLAGVAQINQGGTGQTTRAAGLNALLPDQAGATQYMLLTDGAGNVSWGAQPVAGLPSQTSNGGKLLTTDGTNASWSNAVTVSGGNATVTGTLTAGDNVTIPNAKNFIVRNAAASSTAIRMYADSSDFGYIDCTANTELRLQVGAGTKLSITNTGNVSIPSTTASTSTSSGALVVGNGTSGGLGVGGAANIGGTLTVNNPVVAQGTAITGYQFLAKDTGGTAVGAAYALQTSGGTDKWRWGLRGSAGSLTDSLIFSYLSGSWSDALTLSNAGVVSIPATTASTSTSSGALVVSGGLGVAGSIWAGVRLNVEYPTAANGSEHNVIKGIMGTDATLGALELNMGVLPSATAGSRYGYIACQDSLANRGIYLGGRPGQGPGGATIYVPSTASSTTTSSGALVVSGGVGVAGAIYAGNAINATVNGGASIIGRNGSASSFTSIVAYSGASDEVKGTLTSSTAGVIIVGSQTNHPLAVYVNNAEVARWDTSANFQTRVTGTAPSLATNSTMTFELTSNTSLKIFVRGSDGTTRSTTLTLA